MEETPLDNDSSGRTDKLREHQQRAGRAGGLSRSDKKREAVRSNLAKARLSRWPGREAAAAMRVEASNGSKQQPEKEREVLPDSQGAIAVGGPCRQGSSVNQSDSRASEPKDGEFDL